jgi:hypothetical protein
MMKKALKRAGYKPPSKKREKDEEGKMDFGMDDETLAVSVNRDFKHYVK